MIVHKLTLEEEHTLRVAYIKSKTYKGRSLGEYDDYKNYTMDSIPGVIDAVYYKGHRDYLLDLHFDSQENLSWFLLKYS